MEFFVGVTDKDWFVFLSERQPDEVNFWFPSPKQGFAALPPGGPFLFKLHHPDNYLVGGGFFAQYSRLPLSIAWEAFGQKNGAPDYDSCYQRIIKYRKGSIERDPVIGCVILINPFFFRESEWVAIPSDWKSNIVRGRKYDDSEPFGAAAWQEIEARLATEFSDNLPSSRMDVPSHVRETPLRDRYGQPLVIRPRLGQGAFRILVTEAYQRRCAITGEKTLPVLTAAHIKPYHRSGPHEIGNGLLLRSDLHLLFDRGLLTVTTDHRVEISTRIKESYGNGKEYYRMHGKTLEVLPVRKTEQPDNEYLDWHNRNVFVP
ncbi:MAG: HNH endonuclease [Capsulimonadales bacterium]|nr:HNH endonuclease [Capsulimonadales bacterium]